MLCPRRDSRCLCCLRDKSVFILADCKNEGFQRLSPTAESSKIAGMSELGSGWRHVNSTEILPDLCEIRKEIIIREFLGEPGWRQTCGCKRCGPITKDTRDCSHRKRSMSCILWRQNGCSAKFLGYSLEVRNQFVARYVLALGRDEAGSFEGLVPASEAFDEGRRVKAAAGPIFVPLYGILATLRGDAPQIVKKDPI